MTGRHACGEWPVIFWLFPVLVGWLVVVVMVDVMGKV